MASHDIINQFCRCDCITDVFDKYYFYEISTIHNSSLNIYLCYGIKQSTGMIFIG